MRWVFIAAALLLPMLLSAQTVPVRGGEHDGFTRLVLDLPGETDWRLERDADGDFYRLALGEQPWTIDLSRAFDRIRRDRVASLVASSRTLTIGLGCDCVAQAFRLGDRMLVIDIAAMRQPRGEAAGSAEVPAVLFQPDGEGVFAPVRRSASQLQPLLPRFDRPEIAERVPDLSAVAKEIVADIGHAAASGVLDPALRMDSGESADATEVETDHSSQASTASSARIAVEDIDGRVRIGARACIPDNALRISEWSRGQTARDAIALTRDALFAEFDRVDAESVRNHARQLIYLGFGAEARAVLAVADLPDTAVLQSLAFLVDASPDPSAAFKDQESCPGAAALWSILSGQDSASGRSVNVNAVIEAFEALPDHLKLHLGSRLAERFMILGEQGAGRSILRRTERATGMVTPEMTMLMARLDVADGDPGTAGRRLNTLIAEPGNETPAALVATVEIAEQEGQRVADTVVEMTSALSVERRHDEDGPQLWRAHVISLVVNGAFETAFEALADSRTIPDIVRDEVGEKVVAEMAGSADDLEFLKLAFHDETAGQASKPHIAVAVGRRLLDLGLADAAMDILTRASGSAGDSSIRIATARARLALSEPAEAERLLFDLQGAEAELLRAQARSMMGDHERAGAIFDALGEDDAARRSAWLSGNWLEMAQEEGDALARAAELAARPAADMATRDNGLATIERLSQDAADTRDVLNGLLAQTRLDLEQAD